MLRNKQTTMVLVLALLPFANAEVPVYSVEVIAEYDTTTIVRGASDSGYLVGYQVNSNSQVVPWIATAQDGLDYLPLPAGYLAGAAFGVNNLGVAVGSVSGGGSPFDAGNEPAIWTPNGSGGHDVVVPEQFETVPSVLNPNHPVQGGMAVAINDQGTVVGWSQLQGFQGGPSTRFSVSDPPVNLSELGFAATVTAINNNDIIVGGGLRMNLSTMEVTDLGVPDPPDGTNFTHVIGYAINDSNEAVVAAARATGGNSIWLTFMHNDVDGYLPLNPAQLATLHVGFYDNNKAGDVSASGGILFREEGVRVNSYSQLLDPASSDWVPQLGFIGSDRRVYTTALNNATNTGAIVQLTPHTLVTDLDGDGVADGSDNCTLHANADQRDTDADGFGNVCDADLNNDDIINFQDIAQWALAFNTISFGDEDFNGDGFVNFLDFSKFAEFFLLPPGPSGLVPQ